LSRNFVDFRLDLGNICNDDKDDDDDNDDDDDDDDDGSGSANDLYHAAVSTYMTAAMTCNFPVAATSDTVDDQESGSTASGGGGGGGGGLAPDDWVAQASFNCSSLPTLVYDPQPVAMLV
jgi:hypothetical protein